MSRGGWYWAIVLVLLVGVVYACPGCSCSICPWTRKSTTVELIPECDEVWQQPQGQTEREVTSSTQARQGDQVWTTQGGEAILKWPDVWFRLHDDTQLHCNKIDPTDLQIELDWGTGTGSGTAPWTWTTDHARIQVTGTTVMVSYHPGSQRTVVRVFDGQADVRNLTGDVQKSSRVRAGEWAKVEAGQPPHVSDNLEEMLDLARELGLWDVFHQVELDVQEGFGPDESRVPPDDVDIVFEVTLSPEVVATMETKGTVEVNDRPTLGGGVSEGDAVRTGDDGYAELTFLAGQGSVTVYGDSRVQLESVKPGHVRLFLFSGTTMSNMESEGVGFVVHTEVGEVEGTQAVFITAVDSSGGMLVRSLEGTVRVRAWDTEVELEAGAMIHISPDVLTPTPTRTAMPTWTRTPTRTRKPTSRPTWTRRPTAIPTWTRTPTRTRLPTPTIRVIVDRQGPSIGEPFTFPEWDDICTWGIWIQTEITDPSGVDRAELHYLHVPEVGISDSGIVEMTRDGDSFSATLGPFPEGELRYWIVAWDIPGNESRTDKHRKGVVTC